MSARIPARRIGQSVLAACRPRSTYWMPSAALSTTARRNKKDDDLVNPVLEDYLQKKALEEGPATADARPVNPTIREGDLSKHPSSLFRPEREVPGWREGMTPDQEKALMQQAQEKRQVIESRRERKLTSMTNDPDVRARKHLERKLVIASVKRHGRMTKAQKILRTERQSVYKSHFLPTSVKKLQKVVNQIAGKSISEALVQLRFSKKKVARDVIKGLEIAQNEAIAGRGLGLEGEEAAVARWKKQREATDAGQPRDLWDYKTSAADGKTTKPLKALKTTTIELKDGSKRVVRDPHEMYIDQAWVGRGESWKSPEFRARGAINMLTHRTTSFTVLLKEEKTRIRISEEIKKKRENRKLWTALPDRPVTSQRQYCLW